MSVIKLNWSIPHRLLLSYFKILILFWAVVDDCVYKNSISILSPESQPVTSYSLAHIISQRHSKTNCRLNKFSHWTNSFLFSNSFSSSYDLIHLLVRTESWFSCLCFFLIYNIKEQSNKYIWNRRMSELHSFYISIAVEINQLEMDGQSLLRFRSFVRKNLLHKRVL